MKYYIKQKDYKYYLCTIDSYGNVYDTMRHFKTCKELSKYIADNPLESF